jgi:hypothetical protein
MMGLWSLTDILTFAAFSAALWITVRALLYVYGIALPWHDW